ncbi:hypothetical protein [Novipirellula herctigrandis]|uniref:hypothetical protein n=1 Tax=Novipirellula herctigrandis TaxID=2527986 RepID=UPI003AF3F951
MSFPVGSFATVVDTKTNARAHENPGTNPEYRVVLSFVNFIGIPFCVLPGILQTLATPFVERRGIKGLGLTLTSDENGNNRHKLSSDGPSFRSHNSVTAPGYCQRPTIPEWASTTRTVLVEMTVLVGMIEFVLAVGQPFLIWLDACCIERLGT